MIKKHLARWSTVTAALATAVLLFGGPALAQTTININRENVPTTAAEYMQTCDANLGGSTPDPDEDVWVFNLPGDPNITGVFESITATFTRPNGPVTLTIPTDGGQIVNNLGTSKAWIKLPAGWTLTGATAVISGTAQFFVLTHACAARGSTPTPTATSTATPTTRPTARPTTTPTQLPVTGSSGADSRLMLLTVIGGMMAITGVVMLAGNRRRREQ